MERNGSNPNWYYILDGNQVGPIEEGDFKARIGQNVVGANALCWTQKFGTDWQPVNKTELWLNEIGAPPPLPTTAIESGPAYMYASLPLIGRIVEELLKLNQDKYYGLIVLGYLISYAVLATLDSAAIAKSDRASPNIAWGVFLAPVYLWKRAVVLGEEQILFAIWWVCFVLALVFDA